jgi:hypothetical protein
LFSLLYAITHHVLHHFALKPLSYRCSNCHFGFCRSLS